MNRRRHPNAETRGWPPGGVQPLAFVASAVLHALALVLLSVNPSPQQAPPEVESGVRRELTRLDLSPRPPPVPASPSAPAADGSPRSSPLLARDTAASAPSGAATQPSEAAAAGPAAASSPFRPGFSDPRLYTDAAGRQRRFEEAGAATMRQRFEAARHTADMAAARADSLARASRQLRLLGRRLTVFGDSAAATWSDLSLVHAGGRMVLPTDGREWENLEMQRQSADFVRDSILRERIRSTRARADAARTGSAPGEH